MPPGPTTALPGPRPGRASPLAGWRGPLLVLAVATLAAVAVERLLHRSATRGARESVSAGAARTANALAVAVNHRFALLTGLHAFMETNWGRPGLFADLGDFAARLETAVPGVRTLQWVEGGVIRHTIPLAGNEAVQGYDLRQDPRPFIREDLVRAEQTPGTILSGPTELVQGGLGVIGRRAVRDDAGRLAGVVAIVLDLPPILEEAGVGADPALSVALISPRHGVFSGDRAVVTASPVLLDVPLPEGAWQVAAVPAVGWERAVASRLALARALLAAMVVLVTLVAALVAARRASHAGVREARERQEEAERLGRLFAVMPDGAVVTSMPDSRILELNQGAERMLGLRRDEVLGQPVAELGLWADLTERDQARDVIQREGIVHNFQARFRARDGRPLDVLLSACEIEVDGAPGWLTLFRDVTSQRQLEAQLVHSQKLEAVGRLAGGVAHDFNNLITAIAGYAEFLRAGLPEDDARRADVGEILRATARASRLTQQLLAFGRRQVVHPRVVDLTRLVSGVGSLLRRLLGADIVLEVETTPAPVPVYVDPGQVEQLLVNLAVNARDAMPDGGRLRLTVGADDREAVLTVADNGLGMSAEVKAQAFEPFFTTKDGKGTGLGLATVYGIVRQAGGEIAIESEPAGGTTFTIRLPLSPGEITEPAEESSGEPLAAGSETILVAEDEPQVRRLVERSLQRAGYEVFSAPDGQQALEIARSLGREVHLLVTDVVMPGMRGPELAEQFLAIRPASRVLFISGYTEDVVARRGLAAAGPGFLPKPFTPAELTERVRQLLDAPPEQADRLATRGVPG